MLWKLEAFWYVAMFFLFCDCVSNDDDDDDDDDGGGRTGGGWFQFKPLAITVSDNTVPECLNRSKTFSLGACLTF